MEEIAGEQKHVYFVRLGELENLFEDAERIVTANRVFFEVTEMVIGGDENFDDMVRMGGGYGSCAGARHSC